MVGYYKISSPCKNIHNMILCAGNFFVGRSYVSELNAGCFLTCLNLCDKAQISLTPIWTATDCALNVSGFLWVGILLVLQIKLNIVNL